MKCDKPEQKDRWVSSLNGLMEIYKNIKIFDWEDTRASHKEEIDVRVQAIIMDEQEGRHV